MMFSFRSLNCNCRNRIRSRNVESTKLSNLYIHRRRVVFLFCIFNGTFSQQQETHCATNIFQRHSSREIKVNDEKWNRRYAIPLLDLDCCAILSRNASCKLVVITCPRDTFFTCNVYHNCECREFVSVRKLNVWKKNASSTRSRNDFNGGKRERVSISLLQLAFGVLQPLYFSF